jgi:hypothetical protein
MLRPGDRVRNGPKLVAGSMTRQEVLAVALRRREVLPQVEADVKCMPTNQFSGESIDGFIH